MKLTKEVKLENPKRCDGCNILNLDCTCGLHYRNIPYCSGKLNESGNSVIDYIIRPKQCIKENGE